MAAQFDPWAPQALDLSREAVLTHPVPPLCIANRRTISTTRSTYRLRWNTLAIWDDFPNFVINYWNAVPQYDKQTNITTRAEYGARFRYVGTWSRAANEGNVREQFLQFVEPMHAAAASGLDGAPRPSDEHSKLQSWNSGVEAREMAGIPDFVMVDESAYYPLRVTVMVEVKNPWLVTPQDLDLLILSTAPVSFSLSF
jgi:hypothetical protein